MKRTVQQVAEAVEARVQGDGSVQVSGVASIASASPSDLVFVEDEKYLARALQSGAGAVIAGEFEAGASGKPLLICRHPRLAFARAARFLQDGNYKDKEDGVHASAVVHASARIGAGVLVEARAVIAEGAEIGDGARIGAGCAIGRGVKIGRECEIYPNVTIYAGTTLGERVVVHAGAVLGSDGFGYVRDPKSGRYEKFPQAGRLVIEDDVEIGANCAIDRGSTGDTVIGAGTVLDNLVHIAHNVRLGRYCIVCGQVGIAGSTVVGNGVMIGGQVGISDHVRVGSGARIASKSGVIRDVNEREAVGGYPAMPIREWHRQTAASFRLSQQRPSGIAFTDK